MAEDDDSVYRELIEIHGRDFQRYSIENRVYFVPADDDEEDRLDQQHKVFYYVFNRRHYFPDIGKPVRILDCGCGNGSWAVQMAIDFPDSEVVCNDIFLPDLSEAPDNITLERFDLNNRLLLDKDEEPYDFVHSRCVQGGIKKSRWDSYIRDLRYMLRPGGFVQLAEYYLNFQSDNGSLDPDNNYLSKWSSMFLRCLANLDRDPRIGRKLEEKLRAQRFRHVRSATFRIPIAAWPQGDIEKSIGHENIGNISSLLDSHAIWPFTNAGSGSWTLQDVQNCTAGAKQEIQRPEMKLYVVLIVVSLSYIRKMGEERARLESLDGQKFVEELCPITEHNGELIHVDVASGEAGTT